MRIEQNPCFVLHSRPYRETSLIAEVFSLQEGRISLVVRGARGGGKNSRKALIQPYQKLLIGWYGRGEMGTVNKIESGSVNYPMSGRRLILGFYLNELVMRLLHRHESHADLFNAYESALASLSAGRDEQATLRIFEKRLLESVGFGLVLDHDISSLEPVDEDRVYHYRIEYGPSLATNGRDRGNSIAIHGYTLSSLKNESFNSPAALAEARKLMRGILSSMIGPRPLASRDLYRRYLGFR